MRAAAVAGSWLLAAGLLAAAPAAAGEFTYWVESCTRPAETGCLSGDPELAAWALADWARGAGGRLVFTRVAKEDDARIRIYWAGAREGLYGEARPFRFRGVMGAAVYVRPDARALGPEIRAAAEKDPVFREAIVYLTCVHETGHAIGLAHTADFADIMYSFQFGGDIAEYFQRYRRRLPGRAGIAAASALSDADRRRAAGLPD